MTQFDANSVPISYTLNFAQVNLILEGLSELPVKRAGEFYNAFRSVALQQIQAAEMAHNEQAKSEQTKAEEPTPETQPA